MELDFNHIAFFAALWGFACVYEMLLAVASLFQPKPNAVAFFWSLVFMFGAAFMFGLMK